MPDSPGDNEPVDTNNFKIPLAYIFNSVVEQAAKIEKIKTQNILSIYDNHTIYQARLNKTCFGHFICDVKTFNYGLVKEIAKELQGKLKLVESDLYHLAGGEQ
jgi:hypothetical protein